MKTIQISDEQYAECQRIGAALEHTPDAIAGVLIGDLADKHNQYQNPAEMSELLDFLPYDARTEKRVRHRLADMIREEDSFDDPPFTERAAREVETGVERSIEELLAECRAPRLSTSAEFAAREVETGVERLEFRVVKG